MTQIQTYPTIEFAEIRSPPSGTPGPTSISSPPIATVGGGGERSTRHHQPATSRRMASSVDGIRSYHHPQPIVSERAVAAGIALPPSSRPIPPVLLTSGGGGVGGAASVISETISSASNLSLIENKKKKKQSRHHHHRRRSVSSSSSDSSSSVRSKRRHHKSSSKRHHHKSRRSSSTSSSERSDSPSRKRRHHKKEKIVNVIEDIEECGRCSKQRIVDPLDPALSNLSAKKKERIREELIRRIVRLKRNNPGEDIRLPIRGINDPVVCYRRYRRIARHLYAKRNISSYQLLVFVFTLIVQICMSILFGPAAAEYLKREYEQISKYDAVFYEMGCRAYSPNSTPQSPEYRFAMQLISPVILISVTYFIGRYTPVPPMALSLFNTIANAYLKNQEVVEYRTLLHDEDNDEPDEESDDDEDEDSPRAATASARTPRQKGPRIYIPDLEADLPEQNVGASAVQAAVPGLINMITSLRAQPEGSAPMDGSGMIGTLMNLAQAFMGGNASAAPKPATPAAPKTAAAEPVIYPD